MNIYYNCRHCGVQVGAIDGDQFRTDELGFDQLDNKERQEMLQYDQTGNINVYIICEDCQEALERNPEFHELDTFIQ